MNKQSIAEEVIQLLRPSIKKALSQTPIDHREDLEQELYLRIIKKIWEEDIDRLPGFFEIMDSVQSGGKGTTGRE